jgi:hypothetical protein
VGEVVDDEPRDVPRHPDARRGELMHPVARRSRGRAAAAGRRVVAAHGVAEVEPVRPDNKLSDSEVEPRDGVNGRTARASAND